MPFTSLEILFQSNLDEVTLKVLLGLISTIDTENLIVVNQLKLAKEMGVQKSCFSRAIEILIGKGIILENMHKKVGRSKTYYVNPNFGWTDNTEYL